MAGCGLRHLHREEKAARARQPGAQEGIADLRGADPADSSEIEGVAGVHIMAIEWEASGGVHRARARGCCRAPQVDGA